jgi:hypothetical protein
MNFTSGYISVLWQKNMMGSDAPSPNPGGEAIWQLLNALFFFACQKATPPSPPLSEEPLWRD